LTVISSVMYWVLVKEALKHGPPSSEQPD